MPPTQAITITSSPTIPTTPSPLVEGWSVYHNDLLGYEFSYPPQATISSSGPDFYSTDDVPPDMTFDYFALLGSIYSDWLCVQVSLETGFITIQAPPNRGGKFVTCGVTGVGDYDITQKSETVMIDGKLYPAGGHQVYERNPSATFRSEFFFIQLDDGTRVTYGGSWADTGATYVSYVPVKEVLQQILASYRQVNPLPSCFNAWSQLYPGAFAIVEGGSATHSNPIRSAPDMDANIITELNPGEIVLVVEGPTCANNLVFWKVRNDVNSDTLGWLAEGDGNKHYLVPYHP